MSESIFKFLENKPVFLSPINSDLKCILCQNVMINPCYTPCWCEFCYNCIDNYFRHGHNECPGSNQECSSLQITVNDVIKSPMTNKRILKLQVKCINRDCEYTDSVANIMQHLETCYKSSKHCPLMEYGCIGESMQEHQLKKHMQDNYVHHLTIFKNQMTQLEMKNVHMDNENKELKETVGILKIENREMKEKIEELGERMGRMESASETMTEHLEVFNKFRQDTGLKFNNFRINMESEDDAIKTANARQMNELNLSIKSIQNKVTKMEKEVYIHNLRLGIWILDGIEEKLTRRGEIFRSCPHNSNEGYKMQMGLHLDSSGRRFRFGCRLMKTENDDDLVWPCRNILRIVEMNQETGLGYDFEDIAFTDRTSLKPLDAVNDDEWGRWRWIRDLNSPGSVLLYDRLMIIHQII